MGRRWTPEQRAKQAKAIRRWRRWESSTGPRTEAGNAVSASNAITHGTTSARWRVDLRKLNALLRACKNRLER
ncbi:hypothetical protein [Paraburkholderia sp. CNPSo 3281]|uniref:hypothetical protein n=1 Tax=Paraburkholderia sp. CNPSo 3281 TaxID=2940933 RepID=UPI0020B75041|nr:hypothetical protein [Paraburkholderia sp. CNPSo 3281]MCP3713834.1 hypothetical protein [Paraburkholderia sp. CNPSo 3281]